MSAAPVNGDDENGELEQAPVEARAEAQLFANGRPVFSKQWAVQEGVERAGEIAVVVKQRLALAGARPLGDGIVELLLLCGELRAIDRGEARHAVSSGRSEVAGLVLALIVPRQ